MWDSVKLNYSAHVHRSGSNLLLSAMLWLTDVL